MPYDRYSGDPRLVLTPQGTTFEYQGGQPVMDQGFENCAQISLFTHKKWAGNIFLDPANQIGSDYEEITNRRITLSGLVDDENAAVRALNSKCFGKVTATATNPETDRLEVEITIGSGASLSLTRDRALWNAQINDPAYRRIS